MTNDSRVDYSLYLDFPRDDINFRVLEDSRHEPVANNVFRVTNAHVICAGRRDNPAIARFVHHPLSL